MRLDEQSPRTPTLSVCTRTAPSGKHPSSCSAAQRALGPHLQRCSSRHAHKGPRDSSAPFLPGARQSHAPAPKRVNLLLRPASVRPHFFELGGQWRFVSNWGGPRPGATANLLKGNGAARKRRLSRPIDWRWLWRGTKKTGASGDLPASRLVIGGVPRCLLSARQYLYSVRASLGRVRPTVTCFT